MLVDITEAKPLPNYHLWLRFEDGAEGEANVSGLIPFQRIFAPLQEPSFCNQVSVQYGTVTWPNDADLDPVVLYSQVTGIPIPTYQQETSAANQ